MAADPTAVPTDTGLRAAARSAENVNVALTSPPTW